MLLHVRANICLRISVCESVNAVWLRGAEVSDCLVSVGVKLWRFALSVNLEEFLMELQGCQTSKRGAFSLLFFFQMIRETLKSPTYNSILCLL